MTRGVAADQTAMGSVSYDELRRTKPDAKRNHNNRVFPPCPHCGAQRDRTGKATAKPEMTAWANDSEIPLYYCKCKHCDEHFIAFIGVLPTHASLSALDEQLRKRLRETKRKKNGYLPNTPYPSRGAKRIESDRIEAVIRIKPGKITAGLAKKLHTSGAARAAQYRNNTEEIA